MICNEKAKVLSNKKIAHNIFEAILYSPNISKETKPGQFINILPNKEWGNVMRRPMSVAWQEDGNISIIYKVFGSGTDIISKWKKNFIIDIIGPLGNHWKDFDNKLPILIGGGVGIAPILNLHKDLNKKDVKHILIMGAKTKEEHFMSHSEKNKIFLSTDLDHYGYKGDVIYALEKVLTNIKKEIKVFTCGPPGMMKGVSTFCKNNNIDCDLALETIMACGIGICQGCTIVRNTESIDTYRNHYALACIDGPIFNIKEINNAFL